MNDMASYPGLELRKGTYRFRARVPVEVQAAVEANQKDWKSNTKSKGLRASKWKAVITKDGSLKEAVTKSLSTKDKREAINRYHKVAAEFYDTYTSILATLNGMKIDATEWDAQRIIQDYFRSQDVADAHNFIQRIEDREEVEQNIVDDIANAASDHPQAEYQYIGYASKMLEQEGFDSDPTTEGAQWLMHYLRRADIVLGERNLARLNKNFDPPITDSLFVNSTHSSVPRSAINTQITFGAAFDEYIEEKKLEVRSSKTVPGYQFLRRIFDEIIGADKLLISINRTDCKKVRDVLKKLPPNSSKKKETRNLKIPVAAEKAHDLGLKPLAVLTANGYLSDLAAFFKWAIDEEYAEKNPARNLKVGRDPIPQDRKRRTFSVEELSRIFNAPLFVGCVDDERGYAKPGKNRPRRSRFWIPLISLWTGMRMGEICQLMVGDIVQKEGTYCIVTVWDVEEDDADHSNEEKTTRTLKTDAAARLIPIHSELIRIGFLEFVEQQRNTPDKKLFPELKPDVTDYLSGNYSKWFANFLEKIGVKKSRNNFHSFRHTYRDAMRRAKVSRDTVLSIGGWSEKKTSDNYGDGSLANQARNELEKISYTGLDLSHLYSGK